MTFAIIMGASLFFFILCILCSIKIVPQSEEWTLERFGRFVRILPPGLHIVTPFIYRIGFKVGLRERVLDIPPQDVISKDNARVQVDGVVFFKIFNAQKAAYQVVNLNIAITQLVMTNIRTVMGDMELNEILSNREKVNILLLDVIDKATDPWGVKVLRVEIKDIQTSTSVQQAMSSMIIADRRKKSSITEAEGERKATILKANGRRESAILEAQGEQEAIVLRAQAEKQKAFLIAEARERSAEAESNALLSVGKAAIQGNQTAFQYFLSQKYIESLAKMASSRNSKTVFMPFEASKLLGSLGSLKELLKGMPNPTKDLNE